MTKPITSSYIVNFSESDSGEIRLEEDKDREVEATVITQSGYYVSSENSRYLRMYASPELDAGVFAVTGTLSSAGASVQKGDSEIVFFTPDTMEHSAPPWAVNVRCEQIGRAVSSEGRGVPVSYQFNSATNTYRSSVPAFSVGRLTYDSPYKLYLYKFSGACPVRPPATVDSSGNTIAPLGEVKPRYFDEGLVYAIDSSFTVSASITMEPPECKWSVVGVNFRDTAGDRKLPQIVLEIDPEYPARFRKGGDKLSAVVSVRVYPRDAAVSVVNTYGFHTHGGGDGFLRVEEALVFNNASVATIKYPPVGSVGFRIDKVIGDDGTSDPFKNLHTLRLPGQSIIDVEYSEDGFSYNNPRPRTLGATEVCFVDTFNHPKRVLAYARVSYHTSFTRLDYTFEWNEQESEFHQAIMLVSDDEGRSAQIQLSPPSMKSRTKR